MSEDLPPPVKIIDERSSDSEFMKKAGHLAKTLVPALAVVAGIGAGAAGGIEAVSAATESKTIAVDTYTLGQGETIGELTQAAAADLGKPLNIDTATLDILTPAKEAREQAITANKETELQPGEEFIVSLKQNGFGQVGIHVVPAVQNTQLKDQ